MGTTNYFQPMTSRTPSSPAHQKSALWLLFRERELLIKDRIKLLMRIEETGSLTQAAKAVNLSYKSAWDAIDALNNIAEKPLVAKTAGGRTGGGSMLTNYGREILHAYQKLETEYNGMIGASGDTFAGLHKAAKVLEKLTYKISARNQFYGTVERIANGLVNTEVTLRIGKEIHLTAVLTREAVNALCLKVGSGAIALFKASSPILAASPVPLRTSAVNCLEGTVTEVRKGRVNAVIKLRVDENRVVTVIVTLDSVKELAVKKEQRLFVLIPPSQILIAID
jgi:molybdate transport system regulatory protein